MRKILAVLAALLGLFVSGISAADGIPSEEMREFEFALTDIYYPLLSEEQTEILKNKMPYGMYIWGEYEGLVTETESLSNLVELIPHYIAFGAGLPAKSGKVEVSESIQAKNATIQDGKIRFKLPKEIDKSEEVYGTTRKGSIPLTGFQISMSIEYLSETLGEKPYHNSNLGISFDNRYFTFGFSIAPYAEEKLEGASRREIDYYTKPHRYVRESMSPLPNAVANLVEKDFAPWEGIKMWAIGVISEVNKNGSLSDKPIITNSNPYGSNYLFDEPLLSYNTKIWSIPSSDGFDMRNHISTDGIDVTLNKNIPKNIDRIRARYINRGVLEQFTLYTNAKYKSANAAKYDQSLTTFLLAQTKVRGKLFRIDGAAAYNKNINNFNTDSNCLFDYGVQFLQDREVRYFSRPKSVQNRKDKYEDWEYNKITGSDVSAVLAFEKEIKEWFAKEENSKEKTAACGELLSHAKHILTASKEQLNKEFDETYKSVGAQYMKMQNFMKEVKKNNPDGRFVTKYPNGAEFSGKYQDNGKISDQGAVMKYPNGNGFYYSPKLVDNDPLSHITYGEIRTLPHGGTPSCRAGQFIDGKAEGEGYLTQYENFINETPGCKFGGDFHNGIAVKGKLELTWTVNDIRYELTGNMINAKIEGSAEFEVYWTETGSRKKYTLIFENSSISNSGGLEDKYLNIIKTRLKTIFPLHCDVWKKVGIDK
ncbi:hypothetical protein [Stenoxybacter acetivorans]|uniref:hypothetical protein n=1 Tax=Stenoxybacter acetivorans TaxID=422441 RepID=UPI00056C068D|nr:hypothetical protein [Stenoxybacter acetivorans]